MLVIEVGFSVYRLPKYCFLGRARVHLPFYNLAFLFSRRKQSAYKVCRKLVTGTSSNRHHKFTITRGTSRHRQASCLREGL